MNPGVNNAGAPGVADPTATAPAAASSGGGNWLTHLLPTIGSIAAPVIGGLLAPETGGLSLLAAAGLSGAGSAVGKAAENATEGKNPLSANDVTAGLEGAAGGALGGIGGKLLGKASDMLANRAGDLVDGAAETAATKAATDDAVNKATANNLYYGAIHPTVQNDLQLGENQKLLDGLGIDSTSPQKMQQASLVGNDNADPNTLSLNGVYDEALQSAKPVDMSDFGTVVGQPTGSETAQLTPQELAMAAKQGISPEIAAKGTIEPGSPAGPTGVNVDQTSPLGRALGRFNDRTQNVYGQDGTVNLPKDMSATDVRKLQQAVDAEGRNQQVLINNARNQGLDDTAHLGNLNQLNKVSDQLSSRIKTPEVDQAIAQRTTTPEERQALVTKFGDQLGNHAADTIDSAQGANDLLTPMRNFTQMGKASEMALNDINNVTGSSRAVARAKFENGDKTPVDAQGMPMPQTPAGGGALQNAQKAHEIVTGDGGITSKALKLGVHAVNNPDILRTLSRIGALGSKLAPAVGAGLGAGNAELQDTNGTMEGAMPPAATQQPQSLVSQATSPAGGLSRDDLLTLALYSPSAFSSLVTPSAGQQQQVVAANTAENALSGLNAPPGGGILSQLAGKLGIGSTGEYQRQAENAAQQVAAALPGSNAGTIQRELTDYNAGSGGISSAVQQLLANLNAVKQGNTNGAYQSLMNYVPATSG